MWGHLDLAEADFRIITHYLWLVSAMACDSGKFLDVLKGHRDPVANSLSYGDIALVLGSMISFSKGPFPTSSLSSSDSSVENKGTQH